MKKMKQIMYAIKSSKNYFKHMAHSIFQIKLYPKGYDKKIYKVEVSIHKIQNRNKKTDKDRNAQEYWGWVDTNTTEFRMIQPAYSLFSMGFAGGSVTEEKIGRGKAYRLNVKEIGVIK